MKKYLRHIESISADLERYLENNVQKKPILLMDGTGMLSSYQNAIYSIIGLERFSKFEQVHCVSGSAYALFIFLAIKEKQFRWNADEIDLWNENVRKWHGVTPVLSLLKLLTYKFTGIPAGKFGGHYKACEAIFSESFRNRTLSTFSNAFQFWTYSLKSEKLVLLNATNEYKDLTVSEVISMTASVPSIFGHHQRGDEAFIDAMYAPNFPKFKYDLFKNNQVLHYNMFKNGTRKNITSVRIHEHADGKSLVQRDFNRFLLGFKNTEFTDVTKFALFGMKT